jgi:hypothetical protein
MFIKRLSSNPDISRAGCSRKAPRAMTPLRIVRRRPATQRMRRIGSPLPPGQSVLRSINPLIGQCGLILYQIS